MAILSFTQTFDLTSANKFKMVNTSTGVIVHLRGAFQITSPSGEIVYDNLANYRSIGLSDINTAISNNSQQTIGVVPENGLYKIYFLGYDSGDATDYNTTEYFNYQYSSPTVVVQGQVDVVSPLLTEYDRTVYIVNSVMPTISRVATITYPPILVNNVLTTPTPTVGSTAITTSNLFYAPTTVTMSVVSNLTYAYPASGSNTGFQVVDLVSGEIAFQIDATSYCNLVCGLNNYRKTWVDSINATDETIENYYLLVSYYVTILGLQGCGTPNDISIIIAAMNSVGGFSDCCNCCADTVQQVVGIGGLVNAYNVINTDGYITVTSVVSGNTKTFTLTLSSALVTKVNALVGASVVAGDTTVTVTGVTTGPNTVYTITSHVLEYDATINVGDSVNFAPNTVGQILNLSVTAPISGRFLMLFEGDINTNSHAQNFFYFPSLDGVANTNISVNGSLDIRNYKNSTVADFTQKVGFTTPVELTAEDIVRVSYNTTGTVANTPSLVNGSITLIKVR